ncbi:MAG: N-acetyltransferase, partial [Granulosicoccus sp.]|nr:N-acetyltransferase [Granulosicoccus sp.]
MLIRREQADDHHAIHRLTTDAFAGQSYSDGTEPAIVDGLRAAGDLTLSLVAVKNDAVVGHVAFSPVRIGESNSDWYGLGPISVKPDLQRNGIGSALIIEGLRLLED